MQAVLTGMALGVIGVLALMGGFLAYGLYRNQRVAKGSPILDTTNAVPRLGAIWEAMLHPDRAATWYREIVIGEELHHLKTWDEGGNARFWRRVFPDLDKDLSEQLHIRPDDGRVT